MVESMWPPWWCMGSYIFYSSHLTAGEGHLVPIEQRGSLGPTYKKVNCTLVQALRLCTGHTAHRGSRGIAHSFLTTALEGSEGSVSHPAALYPRERPGTYCTGGWVGPRAGLDRCRKSRPHRDSIAGPSSPQPVAIPTTLPSPPHM